MLFLRNFERFKGGNQLPPIRLLLPRMTGRNMRPPVIYFPNWPLLWLRWAHYFRMRDHGSSLFSAVKNLHLSASVSLSLSPLSLVYSRPCLLKDLVEMIILMSDVSDKQTTTATQKIKWFGSQDGDCWFVYYVCCKLRMVCVRYEGALLSAFSLSQSLPSSSPWPAMQWHAYKWLFAVGGVALSSPNAFCMHLIFNLLLLLVNADCLFANH